ncbi:hypothetical protein ACROYT_G001573 [Oculina patagonica]
MAELEQTPIAQEEQKQVTSTTPATKPAKNPKRVAAGKLAAEKTKQAREAQKKAAVEAAAIIAKEKEKKSAAAKGASLRGSKSSQNVTPPVAEDPPESRFLTTNQWISLLGIGVAIVTTYVKREDIKAFIKEKRSPTIKAPPTLITDDTPVTAESSLRDDFIETSSGVEEYEEDNQQEEARERQRVYNEGYNAGIESTKKVAAGAA